MVSCHKWKTFTRIGIQAYEWEMREKKSELNVGRGKGRGRW
jgi:hypothetical protein